MKLRDVILKEAGVIKVVGEAGEKAKKTGVGERIINGAKRFWNGGEFHPGSNFEAEAFNRLNRQGTKALKNQVNAGVPPSGDPKNWEATLRIYTGGGSKDPASLNEATEQAMDTYYRIREEMARGIKEEEELRKLKLPSNQALIDDKKNYNLLYDRLKGQTENYLTGVKPITLNKGKKLIETQREALSLAEDAQATSQAAKRLEELARINSQRLEQRDALGEQIENLRAQQALHSQLTDPNITSLSLTPEQLERLGISEDALAALETELAMYNGARKSYEAEQSVIPQILTMRSNARRNRAILGAGAAAAGLGTAGVVYGPDLYDSGKRWMEETFSHPYPEPVEGVEFIGLQ